MLVVPLTWAIRDARDLTKTDSRIVAHRWVERNLPRGALIAADTSTPGFEGYRVLYLQLPRPGQPFDPNRDLRQLRDRGVRYAIVTGAVEDRVLAAADLYPRETRFYRDLRSTKRVYSIHPQKTLAGPWVEIYQL